jgi:hypothetical protein
MITSFIIYENGFPSRWGIVSHRRTVDVYNRGVSGSEGNEMVRCAVCGCSRLDSQGVGCALCGGAPALRTERCYITEDTKAKLLASAEELKAFGVTIEEPRSLQKGFHVDPLAVAGLVLQVADSLNSGVLRELVIFLRKVISGEQILRLRFGEPEDVADALAAPSKAVAKAAPKTERSPKKAVKKMKTIKKASKKKR